MSEFKNAILLYQDENDGTKMSEHDLIDYKMGRILRKFSNDLILVILKSGNRVQTVEVLV